MKLHVLEGYIQNIYLVQTQQQLLLLDGCCRADVGVVLRFIKHELQLELSALKALVVTHMHPDHAGGAKRLKQLTGCQLMAANVEGHWYSGLDGYAMHLTDMALARWVGKRKGKGVKKVIYPRHLKFDVLLSDGDVIPGFDDWRVLFTQGHTDRDLSLHHIPSRTVYIADLLVAVKGKFIPPFPVFYPNRYKNSLKTIENLDVDYVLLAHGGQQQKANINFKLALELAPNQPLTHWRSVKKKLQQIKLLKRAA